MSPSAKCLIFSFCLEQAGGLIVVGSSGFLIVAIQSQMPGCYTHTHRFCWASGSLYVPSTGTLIFLYTLAHSLTSFPVLPECHLKDSAAVTPSLQWPLPVPLLICTVTSIPASRSCTIWLIRTSESKTDYELCYMPKTLSCENGTPLALYPFQKPCQGGLQADCLSPRASLAMEEF